MCDLFLEMIKSLGMSEQEMKNHMVFNNPEIFEPFEKAIKALYWYVDTMPVMNG